MNNTFTYKTTWGLICIYNRRPGFTGKYAGLGIHYGSAHREYLKDGVYHKSKSGVAHFLEHKAFAMEEGYDALEAFDSMNCQANAYTSREQTIYFFETSDELLPPLRLLIHMVFSIGFDRKNIASEKDIILSELQESIDNPDSRIYDRILKNLFPNEFYSKEVLGTKTDISRMSYSDLYEAYTSFYTPENAILSVVADMEPDNLFQEIEKEGKGLFYEIHEIKRIPFFKGNPPVKKKIIYEDIPYSEVHVSGILSGFTYKDSLITNMFIALFSNITSIESSFFKNASKLGLLDDEDIAVTVSSSEFGMYFQFDVYTNNPRTMASLLTEKIRNFSSSDMDLHITMQAMKDYLSEYIRAQDSISYIGDETLSLALEGASYSDEVSRIHNVTFEDIKKLASHVRTSELSVLEVFPKK